MATYIVDVKTLESDLGCIYIDRPDLSEDLREVRIGEMPNKSTYNSEQIFADFTIIDKDRKSRMYGFSNQSKRILEPFLGLIDAYIKQLVSSRETILKLEMELHNESRNHDEFFNKVSAIQMSFWRRLIFLFNPKI